MKILVNNKGGSNMDIKWKNEDEDQWVVYSTTGTMFVILGALSTTDILGSTLSMIFVSFGVVLTIIGLYKNISKQKEE